SAPGEKVNSKTHALNVPLEKLAAVASGIGAINTVPDSDGVIRRVPLQFLMDGKAYPTFAARITEAASGIARTPYTSSSDMHATRGGKALPVDKDGRMLLSWRVSNADSQRIAFWQVICSIYPDNCPAEVKKYSPEFFKDKIVILGASASASYDAHNLPLGEQMPGFIIQLNAVEDMMREGAITPAAPWVLPVAVLFMAVAGCTVLMLLPSSVWSTVAGFAIMAAYTVAAFGAFNSQVWIPVAAPLTAFTLAFFTAASIRYATTGKELRRTRGTLDRYISPQLVNYVLEHRDSINLAGEKKELTILFSDVRNFTTMTESADPMELIATLNEYLEEMTDVIFKYDGITDKFIGDGILAYWGAFTPGKNHAELGCRAAIEMLERLQKLNDKWREQGRKELAIGIGLNTGEVVFGNVGSGRKIEFTVIGDAVNLAARLESQTKEYGVMTIISEFTRARLGPGFAVRPLGGVKVKGKTVETSIFELQSESSGDAAADAAVQKA
ncbi:MAG TPA: adenylate/guanylate cyclase domain-containing protein, partial [Terriglobales bacterium]|nr:adenylate/guanylate cyclase domain-containing protein [Terriglobales bacterium]